MKGNFLRRALFSSYFTLLMWSVPSHARFLQADPVGYQDQFNLYAYVGNDPINGTDPTGMFRLEYHGPAPAQERLRTAMENVARSSEFFGERYRIMEQSMKVIEIYPTSEANPRSMEIANDAASTRNGIGTGSRIYIPLEPITLEGQGLGGQNLTATTEDVVAHGVYSHGYDFITGTSPEPMFDPVSGRKLSISPDELQALRVENRYRGIMGEDQRARHDSPVPWDN